VYSHTVDDLATDEVLFGTDKERNNKSRLNIFIAGRVALRRALKSSIRHTVSSTTISSNVGTSISISTGNPIFSFHAMDYSAGTCVDSDSCIPPVLRDPHGAPTLPLWTTGIHYKLDMFIFAENSL
jgi:hypothetical protein